MFLRNTGDILVIFWYFFLYSTRLKAHGIQKKIPKNCLNIHQYFIKTQGITGKYSDTRVVAGILPEGSLMDLPPCLRAFRRLFLNLPLRFLGVGLLMICCRIMMLSSRSSRSISRSASSCSLFFKNSS